MATHFWFTCITTYSQPSHLHWCVLLSFKTDTYPNECVCLSSEVKLQNHVRLFKHTCHRNHRQKGHEIWNTQHILSSSLFCVEQNESRQPVLLLSRQRWSLTPLCEETRRCFRARPLVSKLKWTFSECATGRVRAGQFLCQIGYEVSPVCPLIIWYYAVVPTIRYGYYKEKHWQLKGVWLVKWVNSTKSLLWSKKACLSYLCLALVESCSPGHSEYHVCQNSTSVSLTHSPWKHVICWSSLSWQPL